MSLNLQTNLTSADEIYAALVALHAHLDADESRKANAKLVLLLANHIGDEQVILEAIEMVESG